MVSWSETARDDLRQIYNYIADDSKYYAGEVIDTIIEKTEPLDAFPEIGRVVPELMNENIREIFVYSYRIIYEIYPDKNISIQTIIHAKRDFNEAVNNKTS
ncbi:MAG: type II toxin-antitoxin system RelE/ParE family toxin [Spirochaetae bacterium HGW-Spirochaetae-5]|nr:MAG: type II toxin-antitoxin system RelE/ParE family toxin [Spirochaetae bacterium HGW-Spirochaetae-5]